jgi:hypothetical protein
MPQFIPATHLLVMQFVILPRQISKHCIKIKYILASTKYVFFNKMLILGKSKKASYESE